MTPRRVDFLVAGTQKGGTTVLDAYLRQHQGICMAHQKEVHFFDNDRLFDNTVDYHGYQANFSPTSSEKLLGESTPAYMFWQDAPKRIWQYNPEMKLIFLLRNPLERAYSHWNMQRVRGRDKRPFLQAIQNETTICRKFLPGQCREFSYLARGFYTEQIRRISNFFPREQLLFIESGSLRFSTSSVLRQIWHFLGVEDNSLAFIPTTRSHSGIYHKQMNSEEWEYMLFIYEYEIRQLERMLDWDCSNWLEQRRYV